MKNNSKVMQIPTVLGAVVVCYNLPGVDKSLKLSPETLIGILLGILLLLGYVVLINWAQRRIVKESIHNPERFKLRQEEYKRLLIDGRD